MSVWILSGDLRFQVSKGAFPPNMTHPYRAERGPAIRPSEFGIFFAADWIGSAWREYGPNCLPLLPGREAAGRGEGNDENHHYRRCLDRCQCGVPRLRTRLSTGRGNYKRKVQTKNRLFRSRARKARGAYFGMISSASG